MSKRLEPCPCGEIPEKLHIVEGQCSKWVSVYGSCCGDWNVEFRSQYLPLDSKEIMENAIDEWNGAPRK